MASDSGKSSSFTSQPHVRNACEACHKRKVRCIISQKGGPCNNCQSKGTSCYFLPRYRSGRPRINNVSPPATAEASPIHTAAPSTVATPCLPQQEEPSSTTSTIAPSMTTGINPAVTQTHKGDPFDWNWASMPSPSRQFSRSSLSASISEQEFTSGFEMENNFSLQDASICRSVPELMNDGFVPFQSDDATTNPTLTFDMPGTTWPPTGVPSPEHSSDQDDSYRPKEVSSRDQDFAILLEHITKLHHHLILTGTSDMPASLGATISNSHLLEMLKDVNASCSGLFAVSDEGVFSKAIAPGKLDALDPATTSLMVALIYKIFQVCEIMFDGNVLRNNDLNEMLLYKRLDFNITQARVVIHRIESETQGGILISRDLSHRAAYIENRFKSIR